MCCWQDLRLNYSNGLKIQLKDVLLSPCGREAVRAMVKEAAKLGPEEDESPVKKLKTENKALKLEKEQLLTELQKERQQNEKLQKEQQQNAELYNLLTNLRASAEPTWHETDGAETHPFDEELGLDYAAEGPKAAADEADFYNMFDQ